MRGLPSGKTPAVHQEEALSKLGGWFRGKTTPKGAILVLPTGGGKTFTAARFLTTGPLTAGHKVIWLAHTHHLLDQAFGAFGTGPDGRYELGHIGGQRSTLTLRTVSGTVGHGRVAEIKGSDDMVIITLQTLARALQAQVHRGLQEFLAAAGQVGLTVVFDECHHAPAPSFRKLIEALREAVPGLALLGLTATPTYTDERRQGYLKKLFPQGIRYQANTQDLMLAGILARPIVEEAVTNVQPDFTEQDYQSWANSYRDIPEKVIAHLAQNRERNTLIANTYAENRAKYGQTIIFADRWYQCEALVELLRARGVRADAVFSHQDANLGSVDARNARSADENECVLARFKSGELDVLVNIRMLTEGTDVPNAQSVFLTRQTTSRILLTQMIGRALRGPAFGGTPEAYIVSFIDQWKQHINWARWDDLVDLDVEDSTSKVTSRLPIELVSAELIAHLARELDISELAAVPFLTLLPVGWYVVSYDAAVQPAAPESGLEGEDAEAVAANEAAPDNVEIVRQLIPVYSQDQQGYERLFTELDQVRLDDFGDIDVDDAARLTVQGWVMAHFQTGERLTPLQQDVQSVVRHRARNGSWPKFTPFDARQNHDIDALATQLAFTEQLPRVQENARLRTEFTSDERLWTTLYRNYDQFKRQYDASVNRLLYLQDHPEHVPVISEPDPDLAGPEEVSGAVKMRIRRRDKVCLCCGATKSLQVDHIRSRYVGGTHSEDNLQLLCRLCNNLKATRETDFRTETTPLTSAAQLMASVESMSRNPAWQPSDTVGTAVQRLANMAFGCAAVKRVTVPRADGTMPGRACVVRLKKGNTGRWVAPVLNQALAAWRQDVPDFRKKGVTQIELVDAQDIT